ncbi:hypothetical protein Q765_15005 [Flavobacterium rivuli WB 3.3-2 = DSM 21788]|uniref:Uncharacterized protein n=1 Tax=Flavobacterium rivuli WB 3.3-2 = DSM 21788 TaxID=1121895 RepID=A0A0A2MBS8_9FLAO|nr:hypothetical protein [Flavobacterium rivuli]KGO85725.1 hypothetical protein Q765_15005 [Flavobacterium rivuli WB 3.3-2 = DSM 21788]
MANQKIVLAQLDIDIKGLVAAARQSVEAITAINTELKKLVEMGEDTSGQFAQMKQDMILLTKQLEDQNKAIEAQVTNNHNLADVQAEVIEALKETATAHKNLSDSIAQTDAATTGYVQNATDAANAINSLNQSLSANEALMANSAESTNEQVKTFSDYKDQVTESFASINIFNGGLGGFISRAQEAGGTGPMLKGAFEGMSQGIMGMTKSSLAFIATPIGAVIAAVGIVVSALVSYFKDTQEGIDKVTAVTRPLQSVFNALMGVFQNVGKYLADAFTNPQKSITAFGNLVKDQIVNRFMGMLELLPNLGKSIALVFQGKFAEAGKTALDALGKVATGTNNISDKIAGAAKETEAFLKEAYSRGQKIDELQKKLDKGMADYTKRNSELSIELDRQNTTANDTNATFAQREKAAATAIATAKEHNKLMLDRLDTEIELLTLKQQENGITDAEKNELADMVAKRNDAAAQYASGEKDLQNNLTAIKDAAAEKEKARRQQLVTDALQKQKLELDMYVQLQGEKAKSLSGELEFIEQLRIKKLAIAQSEFNASKKTANDALNLQIARGAITIENAKAVADATARYAHLELELYIAQNPTKIKASEELTEQIIAEEEKRLQYIKDAKDKELQATLKTNADVIEAKRINNEKLSEQDLLYITQKTALDKEYTDTANTNREALDNQEKSRKASQLDAQNKIDIANAQTKYDADLITEETRYGAELTGLKDQLDKKQITLDQYNESVTIAEKEHAKNDEDINLAKNTAIVSQYASMFGNVSQLLGKKTAAGKAAAIAEATMNTYNGVTQVWASDSVLPEPFATPAKIASTAMVVASGLKAVKQIASTKTPKAQKGALFNIGGNRHSNGGTLFTGADGTRFEAEQGELIGVMNRNAAAHFMAFNNAFPAGGSSTPNYFAGGGIVSRDVAQPSLNIDELASKIAMANRAIPAPVVAVQDIIARGNSYIQVRDAANF